MQVLTPSGYVDAATLQVGDSVCAFDENTGAPTVNQVESVVYVDLPEWQRWWKPMVDSGELADYPPFAFFKINRTWTLNSEQSIWRNGTNVCHVRDLVVGDTIYDDADNPVVITSVDPVTSAGWYRFDISGEHSYIVDGLTLHNASRFWVSGTGTWDSSTTTHWGSATGVANNSSVPGSADTVTFDGSSGGGTATLNFGGTINIQSFAGGAFTGTFDNSINNNNMVLSATAGFSGSGAGTRTFKLGSATYTVSTTSNNTAAFSFSTTTGLTLTAASATIDYSGAVAAGISQTFSGGGQSYGTVRISGARRDSGLAINGASTVIGTLDIQAACTVSISNALTINTINQAAQLTLATLSNSTLTVTNPPTLAGTLSAPVAILCSSTTAGATPAIISCASGTFGGTYCCIEGITFTGGATFSFSNSFDLGNRNSGATITAPSAGGPVGQFISHQRGTPY